MKNTLILFSIFFLVIFSAFGQEESVLYAEIQQVKKSNINFENAVFTTVSADMEALKNFTNPSEVFLS